MTIEAAEHHHHRPTTALPLTLPPVRIPPRALRHGLAAGAGGVVLLRAVQVEPAARLDALFATGAHLSGLLAGYGILVMLLLMARVPVIEHGVGADRLARLHARGGRHVLCLCLCLGHALLALCGYAAHTGTDLLAATVELLGYGGIAAATAGTRAARRRRGRLGPGRTLPDTAPTPAPTCSPPPWNSSATAASRPPRPAPALLVA
ncbi:hypothetical protein ACWCP0_21450, partial [Streptomyces sp. NPDC001970]